MANNSFGWMAEPDKALVGPHMEYMRKNRWVLDFAGLPAGMANNAAMSLRLNCQKAARPKISFEETEVKRINGSIFLAGKPKYEPLSVTFYDSMAFAADSDLLNSVPSASDIMEQWRELIYQPGAGDAFGSVGNYKGYAYLHMLSPSMLVTDDPLGPDSYTEGDANQNIIQSWLYQGLFPQNIEYGEVDHGSSDVQEITVTFRYDRAMRVKAGTILS